MKVGDLVELSQYGKQLQCRWRERNLIGIVVAMHGPLVYSVQWNGLPNQKIRPGLWRYDRRELKFVKLKTKKEN